MKKVVGGIITIIGIVMAAWGIHVYVFAKEATSILIGGADGPTSVFIAGKVGNGFGLGTIFVGIILVVAGVVIFIKSKKK
ncbi:MAG: oxaloacetate decarboxylase [Lachnospiraceae bacterium]|mgnify:CR=1 FL=1|nr:oxaloacetate decarboxylase [Lachnospiraceae bacterium]